MWDNFITSKKGSLHENFELSIWNYGFQYTDGNRVSAEKRCKYINAYIYVHTHTHTYT